MGGKLGGKLDAVKEDFRTDATLNRLRRFVGYVPSKLPSATAYYLLDKVPIVQWLPHYSPKWLMNDFIGGLTIGVMLIPQALAYAKIATIPIENGLYSSWIPAAFAVFMGTSKELSTGPTSIMGLLTAEIVEDLEKDGYGAAEIASAVALMVGIYALILGLFELGFILDYVSVPVLSGFISAAALVIASGQVGSLVGLSDVPTGVFNVIGDVLQRLPELDGLTCAMGFGSIAVLYVLEFIGKKWGKMHFAIKLLSSSRAVVVLVIFTLISYLVNKDLEEPLWKVSEVETNGIVPPKVPAATLVQKVAIRAVAPLMACALEHLAIGKAFGLKNGYTIDQSQELNYLGATNIVNSFFGAMPVGGAMSRTAVNSECGVKSPLNGAFTSGFILLTLYVLSPALFWIPKATLAAIIIMAVIHLFGPLSLFYKYWRISFADFVACMLSFWVTIFVSTEVGIAAAVGWSIAYTMLRSAFVKPAVRSSTDNDNYTLPQPITHVSNQTENAGIFIPGDAVVVTFNDSIFFPNAYRAKINALETIQLVYLPTDQGRIKDDSERSWSVASIKRLERLRRELGVNPKATPLTVVVWDFSMVPFVDVAGIQALGELKAETFKHAGKKVQIRMVGMSDKVRNRFRRANWKLVGMEEWREEGVDVVYDSMQRALWDREDKIMEHIVEEVTIEKV